MRNTVKLTLLSLAFLGLGTFASAQSVKFGYVKIQEIVQAMPEMDSAQVKIKAYTQELQKQYEEMTVEFNQKYEDYQQKSATMADVAKKQKERELSDLNTRLTEFGNEAQAEIQKKQVELLAPIFDKAEETIKSIAKANNLLFVFDVAENSGIAYYNETQNVDVTPLVFKQLNLKKK